MRTLLVKTIISVIVLASFNRLSAQDDLDILKNKWLEYICSPNSLYRHLTDKAFIQLRSREVEVSEIQSLSSWKQRQEKIRRILTELTGPFPVKTPLNAKTVRTIDKGSYRVEHIIFESIPGYYVSSSLYIPAVGTRIPKLPAVIYCSGHSADGYRNDVYQHVILNLVKKGFVVFAFDPVGQGERLGYYDGKTGKSSIGGPTLEHSYPGAQAFIAGSSVAMYMIWDGIRSVDYLLTRKEVDRERIGITGRSGGGTQAAYIAAMDDRILAAAPENYITNYKRLLQTIGPQDAEQNIFNLISSGLDHPDFLIARAPKPALMITTTRDMFSIQGAVETEAEVSRIYNAYGKPECFTRVEDDAGHESTKRNREAMYAFFQKHLNNPGFPGDEEIQALTREELQVTPTGQVEISFSSQTIFNLNLRSAEVMNNMLNIARKNPAVFLSGVIASARRLSGYTEPSETDKAVFTGRIQRKNYKVEKYFIKGEGDYVIPYLLFKPAEPGNKAMIYLHPSGKSAEAAADGEIELFVNRGITVLAPDLIGTGEMGPGDLRGDAYFRGASHNLWYVSVLTGQSITGIMSADVIKLIHILKTDSHITEIIGYARKEMSAVLLHSAVFSDDIGSIILIEPYSSFMSIVRNRFYNPFFILSTVPGALKEYDLPDLAAAFAPRKIFISGPVDGTGGVTDTLSINENIAIIKNRYNSIKQGNRLEILPVPATKIDYESLFEWLK